MSKLYSLFLCSLLIYMSSSCTKENESPYYTFGQVGNEWVYERVTLEYYDTVHIDTVTKVVSEHSEKNMVTTTLEFSDGEKKTGTWYFFEGTFGYSEENVIVRNNTNVDDELPTGDNIYTRRLWEADAEVIALGETYYCQKISEVSFNQEAWETIWVHPTDGIIKQSSSYSDPSGSGGVEYRLISKNF